jgi:septum site-determining protein MinC
LPTGPATLYHSGTLRGGQTLQQVGNIVVVGDVNPGAELVASGDIVVFGALRGTAHAGAQGDATARVIALELAATQLRIATFIAADDGKRKARGAEVAFVENERIAIAPFDRKGRD